MGDGRCGLWGVRVTPNLKSRYDVTKGCGDDRKEWTCPLGKGAERTDSGLTVENGRCGGLGVSREQTVVLRGICPYFSLSYLSFS